MKPLLGRIVMMALVAWGGIGCLMLRNDRLPSLDVWPPTSSAGRRSVSLLVRLRAGETPLLRGGAPSALENALYRDAAMKAYRDSGMFTQVFTAFTDADLRVQIDVTHRADASLLWLGPLTMFMIPVYGTDEYAFETTVHDRDGRHLGKVDKAEGLTTWVHLLLLPVAPLTWRAPGALLQDLNRATILEAKSRGIF